MFAFAGKIIVHFLWKTTSFPRHDGIPSWNGRYTFPAKTMLIPGRNDKPSRRRRYKFLGMTIGSDPSISRGERYPFPEGTICATYARFGGRTHSSGRGGMAQGRFLGRTICQLWAGRERISLPTGDYMDCFVDRNLPGGDDIEASDSLDFPKRTIWANYRRRFSLLTRRWD